MARLTPVCQDNRHTPLARIDQENQNSWDMKGDIKKERGVIDQWNDYPDDAPPCGWDSPLRRRLLGAMGASAEARSLLAELAGTEIYLRLDGDRIRWRCLGPQGMTIMQIREVKRLDEALKIELRARVERAKNGDAR